MIRHTVVFRLHHGTGSDREAAFFDAAEVLKDIPGVRNFQTFREISPKNGFDWCFAMDFDNRSAYDAYNTHPDHKAFVDTVWLRDVAEFLEVDLAPV